VVASAAQGKDSVMCGGVENFVDEAETKSPMMNGALDSEWHVALPELQWGWFEEVLLAGGYEMRL